MTWNFKYLWNREIDYKIKQFENIVKNKILLIHSLFFQYNIILFKMYHLWVPTLCQLYDVFVDYRGNICRSDNYIVWNIAVMIKQNL